MKKESERIVYFAGSIWGERLKGIIQNESVSYAIHKYNHNLVRVIGSKYKIRVISPVQYNGHIPDSEISNGIEYKYMKYHGKLGRIKILMQAIRNGCFIKNGMIIADSLNVLLALGISLFKRGRKNKLVLTVTDIPQDVLAHKKTIYSELFLYVLRRADGFIFLTEQTNRDYNLRNKPYIIMEGIANGGKCGGNIRNKTSVYAGGLKKEYYIAEMVDAYDAVAKDDECLLIFGDGDCDVKEYIKKMACGSKHIQYLGTIPNEEILKFEKMAELLINPRPNIGDYTKYSFPSKLIEYMCSGTPALVNRLDGVPDEYYDKLILFSGINREDYKESIRSALDMSAEERERAGEEARTFIMERNGDKNSLMKIEKLIEEISSKEVGV